MRKLATIAATALLVACTTSATVAQPVPERVLLMGSSTTGCAGDLTTPADCYVNIVKAAHPLDEFTVVGRGGTYIAYGSDPAKDWDTYPIPTGHNRVVIQLGINDWYVPVSPSQLRRDVDRLVIRVKQANPGAKIAWLRTWMPAQGDTSDARKAMWTLHGQYTADGMYYARQVNSVGGPVEATFIDMETSPGPRRSTAAGDNGWHYNDLGHGEIADAVNNWLN